MVELHLGIWDFYFFDSVLPKGYYWLCSSGHYIRRARGGDNLAKVDSISFGSIVIDGKKYRRDVFLFPDGSVKQRKGGFWIFGSHNIKREEVEELSRAGAEACVIGIGTNSQAKLSKEANSFAEQAKLELHILPSRQATVKFNQLLETGKKAAALIHITC
jgi:hypothetical protein